MRCFQRTTSAGILRLLFLFAAAAGPAKADEAAPVVIETVNDERLIGRVLEETAEYVRFESATLGEIRIPRDRIRQRSDIAAATTAGGHTPAPTASQPPAAAAAPAAAPQPGALRTLLHLPPSVTASIAAGVNLKAGVVDQTGYTFSLTFGYRGAKDVFNSVFQYEYAKAGAVLAADDFYSDSLLQHDFTATKFLLIGGRYRQDKVMAVDHELNVFATPGIYLTKTPRFEFGVAAGPSWLWQDYGSSAPGLSDPTETYDLGIAGYQFLQFRALPRVTLTQNNLYTRSTEESGKYIYRFLLSATISLHDRLSLVNMFGYGYDSRPAPGVEKGQTSVTSQLSYQF